MIRFKVLGSNRVALVEDGVAYLFDSGGRCYEETKDGAIVKYLGTKDLPIISILSSNRKTSIGVSFGNDTFKNYTTDKDASQCVMYLVQRAKFIRMLKRNGETEGIKFNQAIFIYQEGTNLSDILREFQVKEVNA